MICQKFVIFISHKQSGVWTRYFTRLYIIISSKCVIFLINLDDFFTVVCTGFHEVVVCTRYVPKENSLLEPRKKFTLNMFPNQSSSTVQKKNLRKMSSIDISALVTIKICKTTLQHVSVTPTIKIQDVLTVTQFDQKWGNGYK